MVVILSLALTDESGTEQERVTSPLMWTEQAPHCAMPQPNLVPVRPTCSRITHRSGVSGSASTSCTLPLMLSLAICVLSLRPYGPLRFTRIGRQHGAPARPHRRRFYRCANVLETGLWPGRMPQAVLRGIGQPSRFRLRRLLRARAAVDMPLGVKCRSSTRHSSYLSAGSAV